jgi:hypothetical protein
MGCGVCLKVTGHWQLGKLLRLNKKTARQMACGEMQFEIYPPTTTLTGLLMMPTCRLSTRYITR